MGSLKSYRKKSNRESGVGLNTLGFGLVEVLVAMLVMSITMAAMMTMQFSQAKEARALAEKLTALDLQRTLTQVFSSSGAGSVCNKVVDTKSFRIPSSFPATNVFSINSIPNSTVSGADDLIKVGESLMASKNLKVKSISVDLPDPTDASGIYAAKLNVRFDPDSTVRSLKDLTIQIFLATTRSGQTVTVNGCISGSSSSASTSTSTSNENRWEAGSVQRKDNCTSPFLASGIGGCGGGVPIVGTECGPADFRCQHSWGVSIERLVGGCGQGGCPQYPTTTTTCYYQIYTCKKP